MIATVYRPSRRKNGKRIIGRMFRGRYRFSARERLRDIPLHTNDKQVAEQRLRKVVLDEQQERDGIRAPKQQRVAAAEATTSHIKDFVADRRALGRDEKYVRELERKLLTLVRECGWESASRITHEGFCEWRARQRKHPKTLNEYLNAISGLMNWMEPRLGPNPLRYVKRAQTSGAERTKRRAFTEGELQRLVQAGGRRGVIYLVAARTGIRRGELREIEWRDVHLDGDQPFIRVRASISKNHLAANQALSPDAVDALRSLRSGQPKSGVRVFDDGIPRMEVFKKDLKIAKIEYQDSRGERADFHALRKTYGTMLTLAGVDPRTVMQLMRHRDMRLTNHNYTDVNMLPVSDAIGRLTRYAAKEQDSQIDSQGLVPTSPVVSATVPLEPENPDLLAAGDQTFSPSESATVHASPQSPKHARCRVRTCTTGVDRQQLTLADSQIDSQDFREIASSWFALPTGIRAAIVAIVRSCRLGRTDDRPDRVVSRNGLSHPRPARPKGDKRSASVGPQATKRSAETVRPEPRGFRGRGGERPLTNQILRRSNSAVSKGKTKKKGKI